MAAPVASISSPISAPEQAKPKTVAEAARQFEALLLAQMLRSAREAASAGSEDSTAETMFDMAGQQFAQMLAKNGGLGLAKIITSTVGPAGASQGTALRRSSQGMALRHSANQD